VEKEERKDPTIKDFLKAGYSCLYLQTAEPEVAEAKIKQAMMDLRWESKRFGVWKATTGLLVYSSANAKNASPSNQARDLVQALAFIDTSNEPVVAVFHNLRKMMENFQVIQQLVDTALAARLKGSSIILVGAYLEVPPELKSLITFVDCPLPSRDQIAEGYRKLVTAYRDDLKLPKSKTEVEDLVTGAANAAVGMDSMGAENALALSLATTETISIPVIQAQKEQEVKKSDVLEFIPTEEEMDTLGGFSDMKAWFRRRNRVFTQEARDYGLPYPKGVLLVGPAGTGKSLAAKAIASYLRLLLLRLDMGKIFRSLVGESEFAIRQALKVAEAVSPVVLWIDEIEKGLAGAKSSGDLDSGVTARVVSTLLTWRQETRSPVMIVATANDVTSLPSMVYRRGRFDEVWATDLPTLKEREEIFRIHLKKRKRDPKKFDCPLLAARSTDFVGSEIESDIEDAMFTAFDKDEEVTTKHIIDAIAITVPQSSRNSEELAALREWVKNRARPVSGEGKEEKSVKSGKIRSLNK
jgi:AAA+ superfamily predicted ATPase